MNEVEAPTLSDRDWLEAVVARAQEVVDLLGPANRLTGAEGDLELAQEVLEDLVEPEDVLLQQCLGVVLGNVVVRRSKFQWAVVTNEFGSNLAIHDPETGFTLYPVSMIEKRIRDGRQVDIPELFRSLVADHGIESER